MGRQVNFYLLPKDFGEIQRLIEAGGPVRFLQDRTKQPKPREISTLVIDPEEMGKVDLRAYMARPNDVEHIKTEWIEQQQHWVIDSMDSPVIQLDRCYHDGRLIRQGRVYFATDLRFRNQLPTPDFDRWGRLMMNRIRRHLVLDRSLHPFVYVSPDAIDWLRRNNGALIGPDLMIPKAEIGDPYAKAAARRQR